MNISLYCYTGTGNSLWVARMLAKKLGGTGTEGQADREIHKSGRKDQSDR